MWSTRAQHGGIQYGWHVKHGGNGEIDRFSKYVWVTKLVEIIQFEMEKCHKYAIYKEGTIISVKN